MSKKILQEGNDKDLCGHERCHPQVACIGLKVGSSTNLADRVIARLRIMKCSELVLKIF